MSYCYRKAESTVREAYFVGCWSPTGDTWYHDSEWARRADAADRVHYLNGGTHEEDLQKQMRVQLAVGLMEMRVPWDDMPAKLQDLIDILQL